MSGRCGRRWTVYRDPRDGTWYAECLTHWWDHDRGFPTWREAYDYADRMSRADR